MAVYLALAAAHGCSSEYSSGDGDTENPTIDVDHVSFVVTSNEVHIVGKRGAVDPAGAKVTITVVGDDVGQAIASEADGSFDVKIGTDPNAIIELRLGDGANAERVYLSQDGATVGAGDHGKLSCDQRTKLATDVVNQVLSSDAVRCETPTDCQTVEFATMCRDMCTRTFGKAGLDAFNAAVITANKQFCSGFEADGCARLVPPCVPPGAGPYACVDGQCQQMR